MVLRTSYSCLEVELSESRARLSEANSSLKELHAVLKRNEL